MNNLEIAQFTNGTGGIPPESLFTAIGMIIGTLAMLWVVWVAYSQYQLWASENLSTPGLLIQLVRPVLVLIVLIFVVS